MVTHLIYESPKRDKKRSAPVAESDARTRAWLEGLGWRVVETVGILSEGQTETLAEPAETEASEESSEDVFTHLSEEQRVALVAAGFDSEAALRAATDEQLRDVEGVGPGTVRNIRKFLQPEGQG